MATLSVKTPAVWPEELQQLEPRLQIVVKTLFDAVVEIAADVQADDIIFKHLKGCGAVHTASSEEVPDMVPLGGEGYSVAFDPLDGSSVVMANFAVGSIFGVWPSDQILGKKGEDQAAALYSIYGPRTIVVLAHPHPGSPTGKVVQEFMLVKGTWVLAKASIVIGQQSICAPGNMRAASENLAYQQLLSTWYSERFTLRYSGSMVADVHHLLAKGGGVFISPPSHSAPAKLRLLYECQPLAYIIEAAGGASHDGEGSLLARTVETSSIKSAVCLGSPALVQMCIPALRNDGK